MGQIQGDRPKEAVTDQQLRQILEIAKTIRYGSINLIFQDGVLIQIDRNEKIRVSKDQSGG